ncbi:hypothetical protein ASF36_09005 [Methylobacterium sp. Leaf90]|nr:hypothetical protein ASF36_09005 [Methylobacterium sp. Leaf90]
MVPSPALDGCDEVVEQTIDTQEVIRRFLAAIVPVVALAAFVIEADHPHPVHDIDEAVLEAVR